MRLHNLKVTTKIGQRTGFIVNYKWINDRLCFLIRFENKFEIHYSDAVVIHEDELIEWEREEEYRRQLYAKE